MIEDRELWACANLLIAQHGARARNVALTRAEALRIAGEPKGHQAFEQIASRIATLEIMLPKHPVH